MVMGGIRNVPPHPTPGGAADAKVQSRFTTKDTTPRNVTTPNIVTSAGAPSLTTDYMTPRRVRV